MSDSDETARAADADAHFPRATTDPFDTLLALLGASGAPLDEIDAAEALRRRGGA
ncbi:hypothetical protein [Streptomyces jumonjinensis]|uniref:hypothetical protein n=1 Tax=Streptomyces jumonjinensis TaxID=1945 RepID=UPI0037BBAB0E